MMRTATTEEASADISRDATYTWSTIPADMYNNSKQFVQSIRVLRIIDGVKEAQLKGEGDTVGEFDVFFQVLLILEPF